MKKIVLRFLKTAFGIFSMRVIWSFPTYFFYQWFAMPLFNELPEITFLQAIGLTLLLGLFKNHYVFEKGVLINNDKFKTVSTTMCFHIMIVGFIVHLIIKTFA